VVPLHQPDQFGIDQRIADAVDHRIHPRTRRDLGARQRNGMRDHRDVCAMRILYDRG